MTDPKHDAFASPDGCGLNKLEYAAMHAPPMPLGADLRPDLAETPPEPKLPENMTPEEVADHESWRDAGVAPTTPRIIAFSGEVKKYLKDCETMVAMNECRRSAVWAVTYAKMLIEELNRP